MIQEDRRTGFVGWVEPKAIHLTEEHKHLAHECIKLGNRYYEYYEAIGLAGLNEKRMATNSNHMPVEVFQRTRPMPVHQYTGLKSLALRGTVFNKRDQF